MTTRNLYVKVKKYIDHLVGHAFIRINPEAWMSRAGIRVGKECRFYAIKPGTFGSEPFLVSIGDRVTITDGVKFVTHDGGLWIFRHIEPKIELFSPIQIGNRVFIGINAVILPGTKIADDSIVAAGAVVRGNFPPRSVIGGVPAKVICSVDDYMQKNRRSITTEFYGLTKHRRRQALTSKYSRTDDNNP